jgi:predicted CXXCH cytochrome family protein
VSTAHAFAERRCEVCHTGAVDPRVPRNARPAAAGFRAHTTEAACLTCHDAPAHAVKQTPPPACAACHQDHRGRVQLARMDDGFCVECHGELKTTQGPPKTAIAVHAFPSEHPEFAAVSAGAQDPAKLRFNHAVHLKDSLRGLPTGALATVGPAGPEKLECASCHKPEAGRAGVKAKGPATTGLMAPVTYEQNCARCHPLFFDERIDQTAPHLPPSKVSAFVRQELGVYIREHPGDISKPDSAFRRVPLNFPRPPEPPARNAAEWVERRAWADERLLWNKTCAECHVLGSTSPTTAGFPYYAPANVTTRWMPHAGFNHTPHAMVTCQSCHAADTSTKTSDVLLPGKAVCATCHASSKGGLRPGSGHAESRCFECHQYHDWKKSHPVTPSYSLTDFK